MSTGGEMSIVKEISVDTIRCFVDGHSVASKGTTLKFDGLQHGLRVNSKLCTETLSQKSKQDKPETTRHLFKYI